LRLGKPLIVFIYVIKTNNEQEISNQTLYQTAEACGSHCVVSFPFDGKNINTKESAMTMTQPVMRKELLTANIAGGMPVTKVEIQEVSMNLGIDAPLHLHPCPTVGVVTE
jgi:hypothetical protein